MSHVRRKELIRAKQQAFNAKHYEEGRRPPKVFTEGDAVLVRELQERGLEFKPRWYGPTRILSKLSDEVYIILKADREIKVHVDKLRKAPQGNPEHAEDDPESSDDSDAPSDEPSSGTEEMSSEEEDAGARPRSEKVSKQKLSSTQARVPTTAVPEIIRTCSEPDTSEAVSRESTSARAPTKTVKPIDGMKPRETSKIKSVNKPSLFGHREPFLMVSQPAESSIVTLGRRDPEDRK